MWQRTPTLDLLATEFAQAIADGDHERAEGWLVTAMSEKIVFLTPVKEGELVELKGEVVHVGRTSLRLRIEMYREDLLSGDRSLCTTGEFVMVAVDGNGRPTPIAR